MISPKHFMVFISRIFFFFKDFSGYVDEDEDEDTFFKKYEKTPVMPTPMALHNISKRGK